MKKTGLLVLFLSFIMVTSAVIPVYSSPVSAPDNISPKEQFSNAVPLYYNWTAFWERLDKLITWKTTPIDEDIQISKQDDKNGSRHVILDLKSTIDGTYITTFKINQELVNVEETSLTSVKLQYRDYWLIYNFSDVAELGLQHSYSTEKNIFSFTLEMDVTDGENVFIDPVLIPGGVSGEHYYQHHCWYAEGRWWLFYSDGSNAVYNSTADGSTGWVGGTLFADVVSTQRIDVHYNGTNFFVVVAHTDTYFRLGTPNSDGTITWDAAWQNLGRWEAYTTEPSVSCDENGHAWVIRSKEAVDEAIYVSKNDNLNGTWSDAFTSYKITGTGDQDPEGVAIPLGGDSMYVIYVNGSVGAGDTEKLHGIIYDGSSWGAKHNVTDELVEEYEFSSTYYNGTIYLSYTNSADDHAYLRIYNGTDWETAVDVSETAIVNTPSLMRYLYGGFWSLWGNSDNEIYVRYYNGTTWFNSKLIGTEPSYSGGEASFEVSESTYPYIGLVFYGSFYFDVLDITDWKTTITNMEGCGNWVFAEEKYYHFVANYSYELGYQYFDTVKTRFSDSETNITTVYDYITDVYSIESGSEKIYIQEGTVTTSGIFLATTIDIYFNTKIFDTLDVDIYMWANLTSGVEIGWILPAVNEDYFNIYNLGGYANLTTSAYGGRTTGGEAFEIWAGEEGYTGLLWDDFERDNIEPWGMFRTNTTEYTDADIGAAEVPQDYDPSYSYRSVYFTDESALDEDYALIYNYFKTVTEGVFYAQFMYRPLETTEDQSFVLTNTTDGALGGPWVYFANDNKIYYVNSTGNHIEIHSGYGNDEFKNITFAINVTDQTFDLYYEDALKLDDGEFYAPRTGFNLIYTSTYLYDSPHTNNITHGFVDDIRVWLPPTGGATGGSSQVTVTFRKLQHLHSLFAVGFPNALEEAFSTTGDWYVEWGIDYCIDDEWINNAWKVRIEAQEADVVKAKGWGTTGQNWIQLKASWYKQNTTLIDTEYFYTFWEGGPGGLGSTKEGERADYFRIYIDLWFNRINASSTVGGRVSSYYYGMSDKSDPWFSWWSDWKIAGSERAQSMYFADLEDTTDEIHSSKEIEMMRVRAKVWRSEDYTYECKLEEFDLLSYTNAINEMQGINTPIFTETKTPMMPAGGFLGALSAAFSGIIDALSKALGPAVLKYWTYFVGFMDTIFAYFGFPNAFSDFVSLVETFGGYFATSTGYITSIITPLLTFFAAVFSFIINTFGSVINFLITLGETMMGIIDGTYEATEALNYVLEVFAIDGWTTLFPLILVLSWFLSIDKRYKEQGGGWVAIFFNDVNMIISVMTFMIDFIFRIVSFFIDLLFKLINAIPGI